MDSSVGKEMCCLMFKCLLINTSEMKPCEQSLASRFHFDSLYADFFDNIVFCICDRFVKRAIVPRGLLKHFWTTNCLPFCLGFLSGHNPPRIGLAGNWATRVGSQFCTCQLGSAEPADTVHKLMRPGLEHSLVCKCKMPLSIYCVFFPGPKHLKLVGLEN